MRAVPLAEWDRTVLAQPAAHLLQSAAWGELKARWGWRVERFAWESVGGVTAVAQVLTRRIGRSPFVVGYVPKGPLVARREDPTAWAMVLADLERWARSRRLTLLKIDPDVPASADAVAARWSERGWRPSPEQIQFPNTMVSDLRVGEEALLAAMKPKTRYNLRLAERHGVRVRAAGPEDLGTFYRLYAATAARAGFGIRGRAYYMDVWSTLLALGWATLLLAEQEGRPIAGVLPVAYGRTAWYLYGASADEGRASMAPYLAQWASLCWATERGCTRYDWWGGPAALDERDPLWGVYRFKHGFGATWLQQLGAWDFPASRGRFAAYRRLARLRQAMISGGR